MSAPLPHNEERRIEALRRYKILDTPAERIFDDLVLLASRICGTPIALMTLVDTDRQWLKARVGLNVTETPRDQAFCAYTILTDDVMVVEDATLDQRFAVNPMVTSAPNIRFYAGAPLIDSDGNSLGALCAIDQKPRKLDGEQREALQALARQVVALLEFRRVAAQLAEALTDLRTLQGFLPICSYCKGIRSDKGSWESLEHYVATHADVNFSHGICPECLRVQCPEVYAEFKADGRI